MRGPVSPLSAVQQPAGAGGKYHHVPRLFENLLERLAPRADAALYRDDSRMLIGVISDTHGLLRPEAKRALAGSGLIIHAGDVGDPKILDELLAIAPVIA